MQHLTAELIAHQHIADMRREARTSAAPPSAMRPPARRPADPPLAGHGLPARASHPSPRHHVGRI